MNVSSLVGMFNIIHSSDVLEQQPKVVSKQLELAEVSQEVRAAYTTLPPDVSREMFSNYSLIPEQTLQMLMNNLLTKEFVLNDLAQGNNLDKDWLRGQQISPDTIGVDDEWNTGFDNTSHTDNNEIHSPQINDDTDFTL